MTDAERITALEARIAQLEARIARQEDPRRGVYPSPAWHPAVPQAPSFDFGGYAPYRDWNGREVYSAQATETN